MKFEKEIKTAVRNTFSKEFRDDLGTFYDFFKYYFKPLYFKRYVPILIYQMGKVGSTTILKSLRDYGVNPVYHIHSMNIQNIKMKKEEFKDKGPPYGTPPKHLDKYKKLRPILKENRSVKIISLVREPIWRNISGFFQNLPKYISKEKRRKDLSYLEKIFFRDYDRHDRPEKWFDREIKEVIGMDVYKYEFPKKKGYQTIKEGQYKLLILKLEIPDERMEKAIIDFLNLDDGFKLQKSNVGKKKEYAELYQKFKENVELPQSYIDKMLNSKYTKHFYTEEEIEEARERWS